MLKHFKIDLNSKGKNHVTIIEIMTKLAYYEGGENILEEIIKNADEVDLNASNSNEDINNNHSDFNVISMLLVLIPKAFYCRRERS